jgi:hypothetical protein
MKAYNEAIDVLVEKRHWSSKLCCKIAPALWYGTLPSPTLALNNEGKVFHRHKRSAIALCIICPVMLGLHCIVIPWNVLANFETSLPI